MNDEFVALLDDVTNLLADVNAHQSAQVMGAQAEVSEKLRDYSKYTRECGLFHRGVIAARLVEPEERELEVAIDSMRSAREHMHRVTSRLASSNELDRESLEAAMASVSRSLNRIHERFPRQIAPRPPGRPSTDDPDW
jgi:hypothetical protein